ncbi:MAG: TetR/AcrR family transcriptional regulator [Spongiibacteraceae bacterium]
MEKIEMTAAKKETLRWGVGMRANTESAREKILDAALSCFQKYSHQETCMKQIAQEAKVTRQTLYRHFESRDDIVLHVIIRELTKVLDTIRDLLPTQSTFAEFVVETIAVADEKIRLSPVFELIVHESAMLTTRIHGYDTQMMIVSSLHFQDRFNAAKEAGELLPNTEYDSFVSWLYHVGASFILLPPDLHVTGGIRSMLWRYLIPAIIRPEVLKSYAEQQRQQIALESSSAQEPATLASAG